MSEKLIEIAEYILQVELIAREQNLNFAEYLNVASKLENLTKNLSLEELMLIDEYIENKFLTN